MIAGETERGPLDQDIESRTNTLIDRICQHIEDYYTIPVSLTSHFNPGDR